MVPRLQVPDSRAQEARGDLRLEKHFIRAERFVGISLEAGSEANPGQRTLRLEAKIIVQDGM